MEVITECPNLDPLLLSILSYLPKDSLPAVNKLILTNNTFRNKNNYKRIYQVSSNPNIAIGYQVSNKPDFIYKGPFTAVPYPYLGEIDYFNVNGVTDQNGKINYAPELEWVAKPPGENQFGISLEAIKPKGQGSHPQITVNYNLIPSPSYNGKFEFYIVKSHITGPVHYKSSGGDMKKQAPIGNNQSVSFDLPTNATGFGLGLQPYRYKEVRINSIEVKFVPGVISG